MTVRLFQRCVFASTLVLSIGLWAPATFARDKHIVGWVERVQIRGAARSVVLKAKMDSGAKTSSLSVTRLQRFSRGGRPWVRFDINDANGGSVTFERPVVRNVRIKRHGAASKSRPVVIISICIDSVLKETQVNLADRTNFLYPMLIGRRFLQGDFLIDPGRTFVTKADCAATP